MDGLGYALMSKDTLEGLLDLKGIFMNSKVVSEQPEGIVYLTAVTSLGKQYILKRRNQALNESMHEFRIGIELSKISHPNLAKTYMYFQCPCDWLNEPASFIMMEHVVGMDYSKFRQTLTPDERKLLFRHLCMIVADIQSKIKFTHYDLHTGNILVSLGPEQLLTYSCYGQTYTIVSPFQIKILDYGTSYVENISDDWVEINVNTVFNGAVPNVYDDFFDMAYITAVYMHNENIIHPGINALLTSNSFIPYTGQEGWTVDQIYYVGREKNPGWITILVEGISFITDTFYTNPIPMRKSIDVFFSDLLDDFASYFKLRDVRTIEGQKELQRWLDANTDNPVVKEKILKYQREYGGVMAFNKLNNIRKRTVSVKDLFNEIINLTQ